MFDILLSAAEGTERVADPEFTKHLIWAIVLGALSAVSLPLGSLVGLWTRPTKAITGMMAAFGAGALIAALAIELVAPTALALIHPSLAHGGGDPKMNLIAMLLGAVAGGILFFVLDQLVNAKGGFLRKSALTISYLSARKHERNARVLEALSKVELLRSIPVDHVKQLVNYVRPISFSDGETIFNEGDSGDRMFFVQAGSISLTRGGEELASLGEGAVVGEIALVADSPRTAKGVAKGHVEALSLAKEDFDVIRKESSELDTAVRSLASTRIDELHEHDEAKAEEALGWLKGAKSAIEAGVDLPTVDEMRKAKEEHSGAPLAIWLGILLDGIPESFVIGAALLGVVSGAIASSGSPEFLAVVPFTLIAGLFLSNFPEAMSSSVGMQQQGWGKSKVFFMWFALMVMTAIGAGFGYWLGGTADPTLVLGIEGLAAGAMLTMIASAMLPEAVHLSGQNVVGLSTLIGFLSAVAFKLMEGGAGA